MVFVNLCALERISAPDRCKLTYTFQDMAAHSACDFGGGRTVQLALAKYRQVVWPGILLNPQLTDEELWNHSFSNRTGPAVRPLKDRTRAYTGPVHLKDRPCNRTGKNRLNRPVFNETGEPAGSM
jgi:hypothetical protein